MTGRSRWRRRQSQLFQPRNGPVFWIGFLAVVLIVLFLMRQALNLLGDGGDNWRQVELETAIKRFGDTAMLAHAEWFRQGRGNEVEIRVGEEGRRVRLPMSTNGWPLPPGFTGQMDARQCTELWQQLLAGERTEIELKARWEHYAGNNGWQGRCHFAASARSGSDIKFSYQVHSGHVVVADSI
ncbi:hypothetical protein ACR0ST_00105 [Aliidiomarina sp. Khilg15.8]